MRHHPTPIRADCRSFFITAAVLLALIPGVAHGILPIQKLDYGGDRPGRDGVFDASGRHLYLNAGDAIVALSRDTVSGELSFLDMQRQDIAGVDGLDQVKDLALSPDGRHLYAANFVVGQAELTTFERDTADGTLDYVGVVPMENAIWCCSLLLSSDGSFAYAIAGNGVSVLRRNVASGTLTLLDTYTDLRPPQPFDEFVTTVILLTPDETELFALSGLELVKFDRDAASGLLSNPVHADDFWGEREYPGFDLSGDYAWTPDGLELLMVGGGANDPGTRLRRLFRDPGTGLFAGVIEVDFVGAVASRPQGLGIRDDGLFVYVSASFVGGALSEWSLNQFSGLVWVDVRSDTPPLDDLFLRPYFLIVSPDGRHVYTQEMRRPIMYGFAAAQLRFGEAQLDRTAGVSGLAGAGPVVVSPDGAHVYAASFGDDAIAIFRRPSPLDFQAAFSAPSTTDLEVLRVTPDGRNLYGVGQDGSLSVFSRSPTSGALTHVQQLRDGDPGVDALGALQDVDVSPDSLHVYAAAVGENAVTVFVRQSPGGPLSQLEVHRDGVAGVEGLGGATRVVASGDGRSVYVASASPDRSLVHFLRNPSTGRLSFAGAQPVAVPDGVVDLDLSPDDRHLYAVGLFSESITIASRSASGALTSAGSFDSVTSSPIALTISPDGRKVWVASNGSAELVELFRDRDTGALGRVHRYEDGRDAPLGLENVLGLTPSPDGTRLFVTSVTQNTLIAMVDTAPGVPAPEPGSGAACAVALLTLAALVRRVRTRVALASRERPRSLQRMPQFVRAGVPAA